MPEALAQRRLLTDIPLLAMRNGVAASGQRVLHPESRQENAVNRMTAERQTANQLNNKAAHRQRAAVTA
jgi:hypothetical protein